VAVVCWDEERDTIAVVHQYRHPVRYELVEIPAGLLDMDGEDHVTAARRELAEEAELAAGRWNVLVDITTTPGACEESLRIYLARDPRNASRPDGTLLAPQRRWSLAVVSAGVDAAVNARANTLTWPAREGRYVRALAAELAALAPYGYRVTTDDGTWEGPALLLAVANTRHRRPGGRSLFPHGVVLFVHAHPHSGA